MLICNLQCNAELNVHWEQREITLKVHSHKYSWLPPDRLCLLINILENIKKCVTLYKWLEIYILQPWSWTQYFPASSGSQALQSLQMLVSQKMKDLDYVFHLFSKKQNTGGKKKQTRMRIMKDKDAQR